ncbi:MAG TPA: hypothetical protein PKC18_07040 [Lacipirellulaceae bacterium]|nr:hypothetical protein [Lacipirellulaceae bacterium]
MTPWLIDVYRDLGLAYPALPQDVISTPQSLISESLDMEARAILLALVFASLGLGANAQEFRVETDVFVGDAETAASHTVTLFEKSAVYEFIDHPPQVIVYRQASEEHAGQFILLDPQSRQRTEVPVERVTRLMGKLAQLAAEQSDPVLKFAATPAFHESFDAESGSLTLAHPQWTYRVATVAAEPGGALDRYRDFTDRYAELSTMIHKTFPPGPRLKLNAALAERGVVPVEIRRTIGGDDKSLVRAVHLFSWRLSRDDRQRIDQAQQNLAAYAKVANEKFLAGAGKLSTSKVRGQSE